MFKGKYVYNVCIVRSLQRKTIILALIGPPFKVKFTCHRGKQILWVILGIAVFFMIAHPFLLVHENRSLKIEVAFAFSVHS